MSLSLGIGLGLTMQRAGDGELILAGDGTSLVGWVEGQNAPTSFVLDSGHFRLTRGGLLFPSWCYPIATSIGITYEVSGEFIGGTSGGGIINKSDSQTSASVNSVSILDTTIPASATNTFVATATTTYIHLIVKTGISGSYSDFDNISAKPV